MKRTVVLFAIVLVTSGCMGGADGDVAPENPGNDSTEDIATGTAVQPGQELVYGNFSAYIDSVRPWKGALKLPSGVQWFKINSSLDHQFTEPVEGTEEQMSYMGAPRGPLSLLNFLNDSEAFELMKSRGIDTLNVGATSIQVEERGSFRGFKTVNLSMEGEYTDAKVTVTKKPPFIILRASGSGERAMVLENVRETSRPLYADERPDLTPAMEIGELGPDGEVSSGSRAVIRVDSVVGKEKPDRPELEEHLDRLTRRLRQMRDVGGNELSYDVEIASRGKTGPLAIEFNRPENKTREMVKALIGRNTVALYLPLPQSGSFTLEGDEDSYERGEGSITVDGEEYNSMFFSHDGHHYIRRGQNYYVAAAYAGSIDSVIAQDITQTPTGWKAPVQVGLNEEAADTVDGMMQMYKAESGLLKVNGETAYAFLGSLSRRGAGGVIELPADAKEQEVQSFDAYVTVSSEQRGRLAQSEMENILRHGVGELHLGTVEDF